MLRNSGITSVKKLVIEMASIRGEVATLKMKHACLKKTFTQQNSNLNVLKKKVK
jgi:hypothetical protein